jgi:hypothetical protein
MHHRWPSDRDRGVHDPDRCYWLCVASHAACHAFPKRAYAAGLLVRDDAAIRSEA